VQKVEAKRWLEWAESLVPDLGTKLKSHEQTYKELKRIVQVRNDVLFFLLLLLLFPNSFFLSCRVTPMETKNERSPTITSGHSEHFPEWK
jgi:hypothetical protein